MEFFSVQFLWSLMAIVFIDLVLAGDNAIVIGMAARNLPAGQRKKAIILGTAGAICVRLVTTLIVVWLLKIPALMILGGVLLIWIAYRLLVEKDGHDIGAPDSLASAVKTIIIADGVMGIDNVIGVAGVAYGNMTLIIIGILITIPIIICGSTAFIKLMERYPVLVYFGGGILAWTAGGMISGDPYFAGLFSGIPYIKYLVSAVCVLGVICATWMHNRKDAYSYNNK
jgi:YjbE family integral membrane protein